MYAPENEAEVIEAVREALGTAQRLAIVSGGSKAAVGVGVDAAPLALSGLEGIVDFDPAELVLTVRPGTRLCDLEAVLDAERQMLAFEPFDHGPIFGAAGDTATIGGVVATGAAGSRRLSAGGARDHLLGLRAVSGRGELFVAGAKVVKNVTGYDLPKLAAGSWGRLFAITELTLKVLPRPEMAQTLLLAGLDLRAAGRAMARAMGSAAGVAAAAHQPPSAGVRAVTAFRVEGFAPSVAARLDMLRALLVDFGCAEIAGEDEASCFWSDLRTLAPLASEANLWRVNLPPSAASAFVEPLAAAGARWLIDWAGGLVWIGHDGAPETLREAASRAGGHALLLRAPASVRSLVPAFHPPAPGVAALESRVKRAFDPLGLFETGRF